ncbi:PadR family transcriptional regulator [Acidobacteriota bacterium]
MMKILTVNEEILLLAIWRLKDNAYGVSIREKVAELSGKDIIYGTLYNSLDNLVKKGYVTIKRGEPTAERGGRSKIYYSLTTEAKIALKNSRELHSLLWDGIPETAFGMEISEK